MTEVKKVKSISTKTIGYSAKAIRKMVEDKGEAVFLARFGGIIAESFKGEGTHGEWTGFKGQFLAVGENGLQLTSNTAFFPTNVTGKVIERLEQGEVEITLQVDVYAIETDKNASGYAFMCEPVMSEESKNKLAKMSNTLLKNLPVTIGASQSQEKLAAPKKEKAA